MKRQIYFTLAGLLICYLAGVFTHGLCFAAAEWFVWLPRRSGQGWYTIVTGALVSSLLILLSGESVAVMWILIFTGAAALSLIDLRKCVLFVAGAWFLINIGAPAEVYVSWYIGVIWNAILSFTYEKINVIMKASRINEGIDCIGKKNLRQ